MIPQEIKKVTKIGLLISSAKSLIAGFVQLRSAKFLEMPRIFLKNMEPRSVLFLVLYCGSFKFLNCLLNRYFGEDSNKNAVMAGYLSGVFYLFYPRFTLVSFALVRVVQLLWMKNVKDYKGKDKMKSRLKSVPMSPIVFWATGSLLFISRFMYPHLSSKYMMMCLNLVSGSM